MPFSLTNAPASCQRYVNDTLWELLDIFCVCYLDDILLYSEILEEHHQQVWQVLEKLYNAEPYIKLEKREFNVTTTTSLGFVISLKGISMDPEKVQVVQRWEKPKCVWDPQCFLGFANFYQKFIEGYSCICQPMFNLLKKEKEWNWNKDCQMVFDQLKESFCTAPILKHFDPTLETILETDISDYVVSGILRQKHVENGKPVLHPVTCLSDKMSPAECNYCIGDKELLKIIACLKKWHIYLHALRKPFIIYTNHYNLYTFSTKSLLNQRQAQ